MNPIRLFLALTVALTLASVSCSREEWTVEYGTPKAQLVEANLATKGEAFIGDKVTVKGVVSAVDTSQPDAAWVQLSEGTRCNLRHLKVMAENCEVGEEIYISGILKRTKNGELILDPAVVGDSKMKFQPTD